MFMTERREEVQEETIEENLHLNVEEIRNREIK